MAREVFSEAYTKSIYVFYVSVYTLVYTRVSEMAKSMRTFRLDVELYGRFRDLASRGGYTVTGAVEKFMGACVEKGVLSFLDPVGAGGDVEAEALADEVLRRPPEIGYLTVSRALQWRLQYSRVIEQAGKIHGLQRIG